MDFRGSFVKGQPLAKDKIGIVETCGGVDRLPFVFRVTHGGIEDGKVAPLPFNGIKARGHDVTKADPTHFQDLVQGHLNGQWRGPSPFVSVATDLDPALVFREIHAHQKCREIELHLIQTTGPEWDHEEQRMFHVFSVTAALKLTPSLRPL